MKLPIILYLGRDILFRWRENPFSLVARLIVAGLLIGMAVVILISFHLSAGEIRRNLEAAGAQSILVHEYLTKDGFANRKWVLNAIESLAPRASHQFEKLPSVAENDLRGGIPVFLVDAESTWFWDALGGDAEALYYTDDIPKGVMLSTRVHRSVLSALVLPRPEWAARLVSGPILVAPRERFVNTSLAGLESFTYFEIGGGAKEIERVVSTISLMASESGYKGVTIRDPLNLIRKLDALESNQAIWRVVVVVGFGGTLALVLGVIAFLEFRERRFICALLRSFGLHETLILARYAVDALFIGNCMLVVVSLMVAGLAPQILPTLGVSNAALSQMKGLSFFSYDGYVLLAFVNLGALLSVVPSAISLRNPIGRVLA